MADKDEKEAQAREELARRHRGAVYLKRLLDLRGWIPNDLAAASHTDATTIGLFLSEQRNAGYKAAIKWADALGIPQWQMLFELGIMTQAPEGLEPTDPRLLLIFDEIDAVKTEEERDALLLLIRAYKAGRAGGESKTTSRKRAAAENSNQFALAR